MNTFRLSTILFGALLATGVANVTTGCVADRPSRNSVFNENQYVRKDFLIEGTDANGAAPGNDPGWMMRATITETSTPNLLGGPNIDIFSGEESDVRLVRFRVTSDHLQLLDQMQFSAPTNPNPTTGDEGTGPSNTTGVTQDVINAWPATNVDLKYAVSLDGEKTNQYTENQELDWQVRQWVKLQFDKNDFSDLAPLPFQTLDTLATCGNSDASATLVDGSFNISQDPSGNPANDYFEFTVSVSIPLTFSDQTCLTAYGPALANALRLGKTTVTVNLKYSFMRAKAMTSADPNVPAVTYQPFPLAEKDPIHTKYGPFLWTVWNRDNETQLIAATQYVGRFDPAKPIVWYFDPGFPEYYKPIFVGGGGNPGMQQGTNAVLAATSAKARVQFLNYNDLNSYQDGKGPARNYGDIRYNFLRWVSDQDVQTTFAGVTMPGFDPRTGEIINEGIEFNDFAVKDYYVQRIDAFLQQAGASGGLGTANWVTGKCAAGQTNQVVTPAAIANRNSSDTLYNYMQTYLNLAPSAPATLGPSDFVAVQDQDFYNAYFALAPFEIFADPDMNQFVTREGGQGVYGPASIWQDIQGDGQFQTLTANISAGPSPYADAYNGTGYTFGVQAAANFANQMRDATTAHQKLQLDQMVMNQNLHLDVPGAFSLETVMEQDSQQCINGQWETQAEWTQHIIDTYWQQVFWHEFGHSMGLEHNFMGNIDEPNFVTQRDASGKPLTDANGNTLYTMYSSSIMEYSASPARLAWTQGWGKYDKGAIAWIYANCPATGTACKQPDDPTKDAAATAALSRSGELLGSAPGKEYPYADPLGFCAQGDPDCTAGVQQQFLRCDETHLKYSPMCRQGDLGVTPSQIIANNIANYEWQYQWRNFRDYRKVWDESSYASQVASFIVDNRRFLSQWAFDWSPGELSTTLYRIGIKPPTGAVSAADYYSQLTQKFLVEMSTAGRMVASFDQAVIAQTAGQRPYATVYDTFYGDVTQQGIILDKYFAMQDFVALWQSNNYDQNQAGAYISSWGSFDFDASYTSVAETAVNFMLGGQYQVYPYFAPTAVALFAQDTHNPAFLSGGGRVAAKDWIGGYTASSEQDLVWHFQTLAQAAGLCNAFNSPSDPTTGVISCDTFDVTNSVTTPKDPTDGHFTWVDGLVYNYALIPSQGIYEVARKDRNVVTFHLLQVYNTDLIGSYDDGSNGTYALEYPILYTYDAYNYFEQGGSATSSSSSSSSSDTSN
jgi:hypothetical protein